MTTTNSIASQSIGTSTNVGAGKFPQKVTRQSTTTAILVNVRITNGAAGYAKTDEVRVWFTSSSFDITAALAVNQLRQNAFYVDVRPAQDAAGVSIKSSDIESIQGTYIYFWCDIPTVAVAQTLDVDLVELP
jgi:hypothetical protein